MPKPNSLRGPVYATWIRKRRIVLFWVLTIAFLGCVALWYVHPMLALLSVGAVPFGYVAVIISITAYRFGPFGGDYQNRIHQIITDAVPRGGSVLDVGCGSGSLLIKIARRDPGQECVGVDAWGEEWEYSAQQCEDNASAEGVANVQFRRASALSLPFPDGTFSTVVSCLTFHEVQGSKSKTGPIVEALRVLRSGGTFVFLDLFFDPVGFGSLESVRQAIVESGCEVASAERLSNLVELRFPLNNSKALKHACLIMGTKMAAKSGSRGTLTRISR